MPLKDEHENHDILFQDTENMPRNKKAMWVIWSEYCEWQMKMTYVMKKTKCQVNTVRQSRKRRLRRKRVMEEEGFKFLWKLEAERAKGDGLEIEQVVKKLSEGILRSAGRLFHRAGAWW